MGALYKGAEEFEGVLIVANNNALSVRLTPEQKTQLEAESQRQGLSQNDIIRIALREYLERRISVMSASTLKVIDQAQADTDWSIGYLDGRPVVGNDGAWYKVPVNAAVLNRGDGYVWFLKNGLWESTHGDSWFGNITNSDYITAGGPIYEEEQA
jgi:hypothetical protein